MDKEETMDKAPAGFTSTTEGTKSNEPIEQSPDQFFDGERERAAADKDVDPKHATKGMTTLGYTEASRIENTAEFQEAERKEAERRAAKG